MHFAALFAADDFVTLVYDVENFIQSLCVAHIVFVLFYEWSNWVNLTNCSKVTFSARIWGESCNCSKAAVNFSTGQFCFNSFNIILRRCDKLNFTRRAKATLSSGDNNGWGRRTRATQAESTSGAGKKQSAGILKWPLGS